MNLTLPLFFPRFYLGGFSIISYFLEIGGGQIWTQLQAPLFRRWVTYKFLVSKFGTSPIQHAVTVGKVIVVGTSDHFIQKNVIFKPKHKWA